MTGITQISTADMSRTDWLAQRRESIGGSDAAGIVGLSKWSTPYTVWANKTGRLPDVEDNEAMRQGRDLEDYVAQRFAQETGKKVHRLRAILKNAAYPFAHANVDRMVTGEDAGLECKTTSTLNLRQFQGGEFPEQYYAQCVHYLAVTGCARWYLAVLVYGKGFYTYVLERDQAEIDALMGAERRFWELVKNDTPPVPDGLEATGEAISTIYAEDGGGAVDLFGRDDLLEEYIGLKAQKKAIDERLEEISNIVKLDMGDVQRGAVGGFTVTWKSQTRQTFQAKEFAKAHPEIDLTPFYKSTTTRPFKVAENTKEEQ